MRGGAPPPTTSTDTPRVDKTDEDLSAFKKLVCVSISSSRIHITAN